MLIGDWVGLITLCALVGIGAGCDIRTKKIPVLLLILGAAGVCIGALFPSSIVVRERLIGMIPGGLLFLVGILWHPIGTGDSVLILLAGFGLGFRTLCFFLMVSLLCLFPIALVLVVVRKIGRKDTIPFYPFAAVGMIISLLLGVIP